MTIIDTGLPGKQGKPGNPGLDGIPGTPGITAKNCSVNGTHKLLTPPSIVGIRNELSPLLDTLRH